MLKAFGVTSSIVRPTIEANNFELQLALMSLVESNMEVTPSEHRTNHIHNFIQKCDTIKYNRVCSDAIQARPFCFSLKDNAQD